MSILDREINKYYAEWQRTARTQYPGNKDKADELLHEVLVKLLESDREKIEAIIKRKKLKQYVSNKIRFMATFSNSSFNYKLLKYDRIRTDLNYDIQEDFTSAIPVRLFNEQIDIYISRLPFFERELLLLYALDDFSYQKLSEETNISRSYLYRTIENAKTMLRNSLTLNKYDVNK
jgi:DNA-directed RNA polymerase specialized sigma24 family protein